ncbi:putative membrane protein YgcG [Bradyrhizobium sp. USDA 4454]
MSRGAHSFKQGDLAKAIKAAVKSGVKLRRVEIDPATGRIILFPGEPDPTGASGNEWDDVK